TAQALAAQIRWCFTRPGAIVGDVMAPDKALATLSGSRTGIFSAGDGPGARGANSVVFYATGGDCR
uniref:hypothetical protein n=1 Tax=Cronobacter sakazakii TaxID=28141 RepID=UPI001F419694